MARYIDAERLCRGLKDMASVQYPDKQKAILGVVSTIENTPTADVVEVVRCEKCEYSKLLIDNENRNHFFRHCRMINAFVKDNSFCSYGVRSEGKEVYLNGIQIRKKLL